MKLLHTSDWHFGKLMPTGNDYEEDQRFFLDRLCELIDDKQIGAVLCSGDIYDSARVKGEAIQLFSQGATKICKEKGIPLIVIAGNHDSPSRLSSETMRVFTGVLPGGSSSTMEMSRSP